MWFVSSRRASFSVFSPVACLFCSREEVPLRWLLWCPFFSLRLPLDVIDVCKRTQLADRHIKTDSLLILLWTRCLMVLTLVHSTSIDWCVPPSSRAFSSLNPTDSGSSQSRQSAPTLSKVGQRIDGRGVQAGTATEIKERSTTPSNSRSIRFLLNENSKQTRIQTWWRER